jgi:hypothetical protein
MFKYINEHPEYNTILTTEISRIGAINTTFHKEHCLAKQIQIISKIWILSCFNGKVNQQGEIIFTLFGLFAESEVRLKDLSGKEKN